MPVLLLDTWWIRVGELIRAKVSVDRILLLNSVRIARLVVLFRPFEPPFERLTAGGAFSLNLRRRALLPVQFVVPVEKLSDDFLFGLDRTTLTDKWGASYGQLRKAPRWGIVWRDLTLGWIAFALIIIATIAASHRSPFLALVAGVVAAVLVGFTIAYFMLFLHEAAHCNIHPDRWWNDLLCNVFVSGIIGMDVQSYRQIHWDHHRYFGGPMDSEISYRDPLNLRFLVELLIGVRALKVVLMRGKKLRSTDAEKPKKTRLKTARSVLLGGMVFNGAFLSVLLYFHEWAAMFGWIGGVLVFYPFFGALRQLLEHRGEASLCSAEAENSRQRENRSCLLCNQ